MGRVIWKLKGKRYKIKIETIRGITTICWRLDNLSKSRKCQSGIVIENTESRSQLANREKAIQLLKSQLYEIEIRKQREKQDEIEAGKKKIEWGSQIRSYVLDDKRVKDHRTNFQSNDPFKILDGEIDDFLKSFLMESGISN